MIATQITTHVKDALNRLLQQYKGLTYFEGLISAVVTQIQNLEDGIFPIDSGRQLFNGTTYPAVGAQLDGIGELVGLKRNGLTDQEYLILILGTIAENNSDTTSDTILGIVQAIFQATNVFIETPNSPGQPGKSATISLGFGDPQLPSSLYTVVEQILANSLGAAINIVYLSKFSATKAFAMAGPQAWVAGFGDLNDPTVGGAFGSLIYSNNSQ